MTESPGPANEEFVQRYSSPEVMASYSKIDGLTPAEELLVGSHVRLGDRVMDLGVGTGRTTPALVALASTYVGLDIVPEMVEECRRRHPGLDFRVADATDLTGFATETFDVVVFSFNGIDHLISQSRESCLAECARVLVPEGRLIFSGHNPRAVLVLPRRHSLTPRVSYPRLAATSALRTVRRLARRLPTAAFWTGYGVVRESVHGGFTIQTSTPGVWEKQLAARGFSLDRVVSSGYPHPGRTWEADWFYYAAHKSESGA